MSNKELDTTTTTTTTTINFFKKFSENYHVDMKDRTYTFDNKEFSFCGAECSCKFVDECDTIFGKSSIPYLNEREYNILKEHYPEYFL